MRDRERPSDEWREWGDDPAALNGDPETADGGLPTPAARLGVTDPQHWLDLCA
jgi:hypothetical protein